jgi:hypothetical protein
MFIKYEVQILMTCAIWSVEIIFDGLKMFLIVKDVFSKNLYLK